MSEGLRETQEPTGGEERATSIATFTVSELVDNLPASTAETVAHPPFSQIVEAIRSLHQASPRIAFARRAFDLLLSVLTLALTLPFYPLIMLAIRLDSKGPTIFRQVRVGRDGHPFIVYKFRSMQYVAQTAAPETADAVYQDIVSKWLAGVPLNDSGPTALPASTLALSQGEQKSVRSGQSDVSSKPTNGKNAGASQYKLVNDPRLTRVGRFLRKTSLDELPQFLNVFIGNMSIVGPRPAIPYEVERYAPEYYGRLLVKPGITGLWQVEGRGRVTFQQMIELDLHYVAKNSFWGDVGLVMRTIPAMLLGRGAA